MAPHVLRRVGQGAPQSPFSRPLGAPTSFPMETNVTVALTDREAIAAASDEALLDRLESIVTADLAEAVEVADVDVAMRITTEMFRREMVPSLIESSPAW